MSQIRNEGRKPRKEGSQGRKKGGQGRKQGANEVRMKTKKRRRSK